MRKIVSGALLLGLISPVDVFAETNAYLTNTEVPFYGEYEPPANKEKPDGKISQRFPKQSEVTLAVSGEPLKHSASKTADQKGSGFLPRTGIKQQQIFNHLGIVVIFMANFILKKRKKEQ